MIKGFEIWIYLLERHLYFCVNPYLLVVLSNIVYYETLDSLHLQNSDFLYAFRLRASYLLMRLMLLGLPVSNGKVTQRKLCINYLWKWTGLNKMR